MTGVRGRGSKSRNSNRYGSFGGGSSTGPDGKPINRKSIFCVSLKYILEGKQYHNNLDMHDF